MFSDRDFVAARDDHPTDADLIADLDLATLWRAMAGDDEVIFTSVRTAMLRGLTDPDEIQFRQAVLNDCIANSQVVRELYALAVQAVADQHEVLRSIFSSKGEAWLRRSVRVLELFAGALERLRSLATNDADGFQSDGFMRFFATIREQLSDEYLSEVAEYLKALQFHDGVFATAGLGRLGQGVDYVLRTSPPHHKILRFLSPSLPDPSFSWTVPPRDYGGGQEMEALRNRVLTSVAEAVGRSTDHITAFFIALRRELGFYIGCLNLHDRLSEKGEPIATPDPEPLGMAIRHGCGIYDPCLSLRLDGRAQGNDLAADDKSVIMITGANQGGKSTFLRSLGLAQLMMQAGMFVAAEQYRATTVGRVLTHYKREEDASMRSGKFDEELTRMRVLIDIIDGDDLLLCNESFAATNEREGSEIAGDLIRALTDSGNTVVFVTHLYDLAASYVEFHSDITLFLRAARGEDGNRPFEVREGKPLPTSYGADLYRKTFGTELTGH